MSGDYSFQLTVRYVLEIAQVPHENIPCRVAFQFVSLCNETIYLNIVSLYLTLISLNVLGCFFFFYFTLYGVTNRVHALK